MPAIKCPFCQHENTPGTRFCSECGFSIHLKICPNSKCGQISDVGAAVCVHCGQHFPEAAHSTTEIAKPAEVAGSRKPDVDPVVPGKGKPLVAAWPLIMVAIFAGGLPILWINRAQLPAPKTWQSSTPDAATTGGAPVPNALNVPASPPIPVSAVAAPSSAKVVAQDDAGSRTAAPSLSAAATAGTKPVPGDTPKKVSKAPSAKVVGTRPCTDATIALGLCDPKQAAK